ncbi:MAG: phosphatase PAP2 family protein, partial [Terracidiphilus sp.]
QGVTGPQPAQPADAALPDAPLPQAQDPAPAPTEQDVTLRGLPRNLLRDQAAIWTSPRHINADNAGWLAVLALATTVAVTADHQAMTDVVPRDKTLNDRALTASNAVVGGFIAAPPLLFSWGQFRSNPLARETGILTGEALLDGLVVEQGVKLIAWRERPSADKAKGKFFQSSAGADSSFPSSHCLLAWSAASVIAHEYPSFPVQLGVYGLATGVGVTRVLSREHFPADVLAGSALGWMVGRYVFHKHHRVWQE